MTKFSHLAIVLCVVGAFIGGTFAVNAKEDLTITAEQRKLLEMFRKRMSSKLYLDYMNEDLYLLRFLRVKEWNLRNAEILLDEHIEWRKENDMDNIHNEDWSDMTKDYPYEVYGYDKEGRPVGTVSIATWDIRKAVMQGKMPRLQRYMSKMLDEISLKVINLRKEGNTTVTRWVLLTNVEGFNVIQHACSSCTSLWVNFLRSYEHNYPNTANSIYAINSPDTFNLVLRLLQPSIPKTSKEAIKILSSNRSEWKAYLDQVIDPNQRTKEYGGIRDK